MPKNEAEYKWTCDECTYSNWPSAMRCAMCYTVPLQNTYITTSNELVEKDSIEEENSNVDLTLKWNCSTCSYKNWMKSKVCIMCRTTRPGEYKSDDNPQCNENKEHFYHDNRMKSIMKSHKWSCLKCTYENWPKALKCIICQHPKNKSYRRDDNQWTVDGSDKKQYNKKKLNSPRRSPPRSPNSLISKNFFSATKSDEDRIITLTDGIGKLHCSNEVSQRITEICNHLTSMDFIWLAACKGVADREMEAVSSYLAAGGDRTRQLTEDDILILNEPGLFEAGHTLVHLAIKYQFEDVLRLLLIPEVPHRSLKKLPSHVCPELSFSIRKQLIHSIRTRKKEFPCPFFTELVTFSLPSEILKFDTHVQHQLFREIVDIDVRQVLEEESLINWSSELSNQYSSRLCPLWNRAAGDCLLDSVLQATWGVFDRDNALRKKLYEALSEGQDRFFPRWQEAEEIQANEMNYTLEAQQWKHDWTNIVRLAAMAGNSLEQTHVFALAHILRRPIVVYAVKYVKSLRGESIDLARFEGVYLPLLWEEDFCWKNPIALGYTSGHFSALVPLESMKYANNAGAGADWNEAEGHVTYLPLIDHEGHLLPVHFLTSDEIGLEEQLLQKRLDCCLTDAGILAAKQTITARPALVSQMVDEWMNRYRKVQEEINQTNGASK